VSEPDPVVGRLREEISELDRTVLESVNARLELVAELKRHKESRGIGFVDQEREARMLADLVAANGGPLSAEGVRELLGALLDLTKRELET
jgi:chorismate mutase